MCAVSLLRFRAVMPSILQGRARLCPGCGKLRRAKFFSRHNTCHNCRNATIHQHTRDEGTTHAPIAPPSPLPCSLPPPGRASPPQLQRRLGLRRRKPFEKLSRAQQFTRVREARHHLEVLGVPLSALLSPRPRVDALLHLTASERRAVRSIPGLNIPSEKKLIQCRMQLATTHGIATGTFKVGDMVGAYVTDPDRFIKKVVLRDRLVPNSPFCVGGDYGGDSCKLGITYTNEKGVQVFDALMVFTGKDDWESLQQLALPGVIPFTGTSGPGQLNFLSIFQVLQAYLMRTDCLVNGDWLFLNAVLGLKNASAHHPCPICTVHKDSLLGTDLYPTPSPLRNPFAPIGEHSKKHHALLHPSPDRIVPLPLHILLGVCNKIINDVFPALLRSEEPVKAAVAKVKSVHSYGSVGLASVHGLNGAEIARWVDRDFSGELFEDAPITAQGKMEQLAGWMKGLKTHLLHKQQWTAGQQGVFSSFVQEMQRNWSATTGCPPTPKLHMLSHAVDFAQKHNHLGLHSESQIESYHATFNYSFRHTHRNKGRHTDERLRRCLADQLIPSAANLGTDLYPASPNQ